MSVLGEVMITARKARGLTQQQLAEKSGVTQATLSRWENSDRTPSEEHTASVARALGVTPALLSHASRVRGATAINAHMRRQRTAPVGVWQRLEAQLNMYRLHVGQLMEEVTVRAEQRVPRFDVVEHTPADAARLVRTQWRMPLTPVRSLTTWLEAAGCLVIAKDFGTHRVDGLSQWAGPQPLILTNSTSPVDRVRWTMAHELGHLVLHETDASAGMEAEADAFAAELLMPADLIRPQLRNLDLGKLQDLKRYWGVSMAALIERGHGLGVVTPTQRTRFYKQRSARGWIAKEPVSDELAPEVPRLLLHITAALTERGLNAEDVAAVAGFANPRDNDLFLMPATRRRGLHAV